MTQPLENLIDPATLARLHELAEELRAREGVTFTLIDYAAMLVHDTGAGRS